MTAIVVLYRLLLRLYPPAFRARFGDEIGEGFSRGLRSRAGTSARLRYLAAAMIDLPRSAAAEWWRTLRPPTRRDQHQNTRTGSMDMIRQDLRHACRSLRQNPGFTAAVVLTLALGVGANTAVFSLVDAVLLRPLPIPEPDRVVAVFNARRESPESNAYGLDGGLSYSSFRALQGATRSLSALAGFIDVEVGMQGDRGVQQLTAGAVSGDYFPLLGLRPAVGRLISPADDQKGAPQPVAVLSDTLWARDFDRDPQVVGRVIHLGGTAFTVVGVAPARFRGTRLTSRPQLWVPLTTITSLRAGGIWNGALGKMMLGDHPLGWVIAIGRLADEVTPALAAAELQPLMRGINGARRTPPSIPGVAVPPEREIVVRPVVEAATLGDRRGLVRFVGVLSAVVGVTLLIACMNVANLVLVRSTGRARELAVRVALGAGRFRLMWQLFLENLILAGLGAIAAMAVAIATMRLLSAFALPGQIALDQVGLGLDARVLGVAAALAIVTALLIGLGPAVRASAPDSQVLLRAHGIGGRRAPWGVLIVGQVALTLVLLVGAGLFIRSLRAGLRTDLGFDPAPLAAVSVDLFRYGYDVPRARTYYAETTERASALPGVGGVAFATHLPLSVVGTMDFDAPTGVRTVADPVRAGINRVTASYFEVMGMPLVAGRAFGANVRGAPREAILNESAARALFGGASPLGKEIRIYGARPSIVVGVVRDAKYAGVRDIDVPMVHEDFQQDVPTGGVVVLVRSADPGRTLSELRQVLLAIDPAVAQYDGRLVAEQVDAALMTQRFGTMLLGLFAVIALCVAAVGIYSVVAYTVSQRTAELGIRVALGAGGGDVLRVVVGRSGVAIVAGALLGLAVAVPSSRALERFLYDVPPLDRVSFGVAGALLALAAVGAILMPARRALRTDPLIALRRE